jgi:DNA-binding response OmpR family regulator
VRAAGFDAVEASDADEAISSQVATDIEMPGSMDGLRLAAAVRDRWPPIKIITASGRVRVEHNDLPSGGRFLPKPYSGREVAAHLKERRLAIIIDNDNRYSAGGHSMRIRGEQRAGTRDHNRREHSNSIYIRCSTQERSRSCTLGHTRRNKQEHSRHSSRSPVRHNSHNPVRRRRRWTLCHRPAD